MEKKIVLIAEDNKITAMTEKAALEKSGYDVIIAENREDVLSKVKNNININVILMDLELGEGMKDINVITVAEEILQIREIPIVFCTGHIEKEYFEKAKKVSRYGYVLKSAGLLALIETVDIAVELFEKTKELNISKEFIQEERERLSDIISGTNAGTWEWNIQTGATIFNKRWAEIIGYSLEELSPITIDTWIKFTHPEDIKKSEDILNKHFSGELPYYEVECRMKHKNGEWVWVLDRGKVIKWSEDGKPLMMFGTHQDITKQKEMEEALKKSEEEFRTMVENAPLGIIHFNKDCIINSCNEKFEEIIGAPKSRLIGMDMLKLPNQKMVEAIKSISKGEIGKYEGRYISATGNKDSIVHTVFSPVKRQDGEIIGGIGIVEDVSEKHYIEKKLEESEKNFRNFFESMTEMIFVCDKTGKIIYANPIVTQTLEYSKEELRGMEILNLHPEELREEALCIVTDMFKGNRENCPLPLLTKSGKRVPVETKIWFGEWNGEECMFGISKNLTFEQEVRQQFERLFQNNPALMAVSNRENSKFFIDVNEVFLRTLGYKREEVIGRNAVELNLFTDIKKYEYARETLLKEGKINDFEIEIRTKSGEKKHGIFSGEIIKNQGKEYLLTVMIDITDRKQNEEKIREITRELEVILNTAPVGISHLKDRKILWSNSEHDNMFGYKRGELTGKGLELLYENMENFEEIGKDIYKKINAGEKYSNEIKMKKKMDHLSGYI